MNYSIIEEILTKNPKNHPLIVTIPIIIKIIIQAMKVQIRSNNKKIAIQANIHSVISKNNQKNNFFPKIKKNKINLKIYSKN